jgi:hypothetical protein
MLQVTFRDLFPSETLLRVAHDWYRRLCAARGNSAAPFSCEVVVSKLTGGASNSDQYRVRVDTVSRPHVPVAVVQDTSPERALRKALAATELMMPELSHVVATLKAEPDGTEPRF